MIVEPLFLDMYYQWEPGPDQGWWYWYCGPGSLVKTDAVGPFPDVDEAWNHAREENPNYVQNRETPVAGSPN